MDVPIVRTEGRDVVVEYKGAGGQAQVARLRFGINEMIATQQEWGIKDDQEFLNLMDNLPSLGRYRVLIKHALRPAQPETTLEQAGDLITELGMDAMRKAFEAMTRWAFPDREATPPAPDPGKGPAASLGPLPS